MKLLIYVILFVAVTQVYGGVKIHKYIGSSRNCIGLNNTELNRFQSSFKEIKGIHSSALNEIMNTMRKFRRNCPVIKLFKGIDEFLRNDLQAHMSVLSAFQIERYFKRLQSQLEINEIGDILDEYEKVFSKKLTPSQVNRIMTFVRMLEGTPMKISNSLMFLYGSLQSTTPTNIGESNKKTCLSLCVERHL